MQSLNLSGESKKSDGRLKSLFWPTVENAWDVDYLGQQGFWICFVIGVINFAATAIAPVGTPLVAARVILVAFGAIAFFVYWVGGMGVREHSFAASVLILAMYVVAQLASGAVGPVVIIIAAVLLSNIRATFLASRWKPIAEDEDRPTRFNETLRDKMVDQIPAKAWPVLKIPFFISASVLLLLMVFGALVNLTQRRARSIPNQDPAATTVVVAPPDSH